jgi:hypothetical protein
VGVGDGELGAGVVRPEDRDALGTASPAALDDLDLAVEDHEHVVPRVALLKERGSRRNAALLERAREVVEHFVGQRSEHANLTQPRDRRRRVDGRSDGKARLAAHDERSLLNTIRFRPSPA